MFENSKPRVGDPHPRDPNLIWNGFEYHPGSKKVLRPEQREAERTHDLEHAVKQILGVIEGIEESRREGLTDTP